MFLVYIFVLSPKMMTMFSRFIRIFSKIDIPVKLLIMGFSEPKMRTNKILTKCEQIRGETKTRGIMKTENNTFELSVSTFMSSSLI